MKQVKYWWPTIALMLVIFFLSERQRVKVSDIFAVQFMFFKSLHVIKYALLYVLSYRSFRNTSNRVDWKNRYDAFLLSLSYAIFDEVHQVFVPTREGRFRDILIDSLGITLMAIYLWKLLPKAHPRLKTWAKKLQIS